MSQSFRRSKSLNPFASAISRPVKHQDYGDRLRTVFIWRIPKPSRAAFEYPGKTALGKAEAEERSINGRYFEVAERSHPGVGEKAAPGYSARTAVRACSRNHLQVNAV